MVDFAKALLDRRRFENNDAWYYHSANCRTCERYESPEIAPAAAIPHLCQYGKKNTYQWIELSKEDRESQALG